MKARIHQLNIEESRAVYDNCGPWMEPKDCYRNIFEAIDYYYFSKIVNGVWKIAYGYFRSVDQIYVRHCFFVDENNQAIDPTLFTAEDPRLEGRQYMTFKIFEFDEYIEALKQEDGFVALFSYLQDVEFAIAVPWAEETGVTLMGK